MSIIPQQASIQLTPYQQMLAEYGLNPVEAAQYQPGFMVARSAPEKIDGRKFNKGRGASAASLKAREYIADGMTVPDAAKKAGANPGCLYAWLKATGTPYAKLSVEEVNEKRRAAAKARVYTVGKPNKFRPVKGFDEGRKVQIALRLPKDVFSAVAAKSEEAGVSVGSFIASVVGKAVSGAA